MITEAELREANQRITNRLEEAKVDLWQLREEIKKSNSPRLAEALEMIDEVEAQLVLMIADMPNSRDRTKPS